MNDYKNYLHLPDANAYAEGLKLLDILFDLRRENKLFVPSDYARFSLLPDIVYVIGPENEYVGNGIVWEHLRTVEEGGRFPNLDLLLFSRFEFDKNYEQLFYDNLRYKFPSNWVWKSELLK